MTKNYYLPTSTNETIRAEAGEGEQVILANDHIYVKVGQLKFSSLRKFPEPKFKSYMHSNIHKKQRGYPTSLR